MEEIWKDIEGYEGIYKVSSRSRVKSIDRQAVRSDGVTVNYRSKIIKPSLKKTSCKKHKYSCVNLSKNGTSKLHYIHRLVLQAFVPNPNNKPFVNHIDGNTQNNSIENLEWTTNKENLRHGARLNKGHNMTIKKARKLRDKYKKGNIKINDICSKEGMSYTSVTNLLYGYNWA